MVGSQNRNLRYENLLERVLEGFHCPMASEARVLQLVHFSIRVAKEVLADFTAERDIGDTVRDLACKTMKPIEDIMGQFGSYNLVITDCISHCGHCMHDGCLRCRYKKGCCMKI